MPEIEDIERRLAGVKGRPWKYDPAHEMFVGVTNAMVTHDAVIDLGRSGTEWEPYVNEAGLGSYRRTEASQKRKQRVAALGEFLQSCREDIAFLLNRVKVLENTQPEHEKCA